MGVLLRKADAAAVGTTSRRSDTRAWAPFALAKGGGHQRLKGACFLDSAREHIERGHRDGRGIAETSESLLGRDDPEDEQQNDRAEDGRGRRNFDENEQFRLIEAGLANLDRAGAQKVRAFRAGSFASNRDTLAAVGHSGLALDSSFRLRIPDSGKRPLIFDRCVTLNGVKEYPLATYEDWPGHLRHVQITACSATEFEFVFEQARAQHWDALVVLSHSAELLNADRSRPDRLVVRRFERICRFLADHRPLCQHR